jgi:hypothetical protein
VSKIFLLSTSETNVSQLLILFGGILFSSIVLNQIRSLLIKRQALATLTRLAATLTPKERYLLLRRGVLVILLISVTTISIQVATRVIAAIFTTIKEFTFLVYPPLDSIQAGYFEIAFLA